MSNPDTRPPSEEGQEPSEPPSIRASEVSTEEASSSFGSINEDKENRPPTHSPPQPQFIQYVEESDHEEEERDDHGEEGNNVLYGSPAYEDRNRVEYGNDPFVLFEAIRDRFQKAVDIQEMRRIWYGEDAGEALRHRFRFTPERVRDRAAARHGGQTFYQYLAAIGEVVDPDDIAGDETELQLEENYERRKAEWKDGSHPDAAPDWDEGDEYDQGDNHDQGDDYDDGDRNDGDRDRGKRKRAESESDTPHKSSDSGDRGDDEDGSGTPSTDRTRSMPSSESGSWKPKRRRLRRDVSDNGRESTGQRTPEQSRLDEAVSRQLQLELYQEQPEPTDEEHQRQQDERRDLFFRAKETGESLDRRQSGQMNPEPEERIQPQQLPQPQPQPQQQASGEGKEEEQRLKTRQEHERERTLRLELEEIQDHRDLVQTHLRGLQERLKLNGRLTSRQQQSWEIQMEQLEVLQNREITIQQRQRVVEQDSRIRDRQYQAERIYEQYLLVLNRQEQVTGQLRRNRQQRGPREMRSSERIEEIAFDQELDQLDRQEEEMRQRLQVARQQLQEMHDDQRAQEERWEELRDRQDRLEQALQERQERELQEDQEDQPQQQQQQQQQIRRQPGDPWSDQLWQLERQHRRDREQEEEQAQRRPRQPRQLGTYPVESQNQAPPIPRHIIGLQGPQQPQQQQQGRRQQGGYPAQSQNQRRPPPEWPLKPQQPLQQSRQHGSHSTSQHQSQWSDSDDSSSPSPRKRKRSTILEDIEEEEEEEAYGRSTPKRARKEGPEPEEGPDLTAAQAATLALRRVIEETPQIVEGEAGQTPGQGSGQAPRQLLPAAEVRSRPTPGGMQVSTIFTNPRTRQVIRPQGFAGRPRASGGAWVVTDEEAANAREQIREERRISEQQAALEQSTTRPVLHDNSQPPSPSPVQPPERPRQSLPALPRPLSLVPGPIARQPSAHPQTPVPVEPPIHSQPPSYLSGPARIQSRPYPPAPATVEPPILPPVQLAAYPSVPATIQSPLQAPAEAPAAAPPPPPPPPPAPESAQAPAPARPPTRRGRAQPPAAGVRKSTRKRRQTLEARESEEQAAATRRPRQGGQQRQTLRQRQRQRQRQSQTRSQAQAQPPAQNQPPAQTQTVNSNTGQAPAQNNPQPQRRQSRRQIRRSQPYDVSTLRRSTRNRKPPDRYAPPQW